MIIVRDTSNTAVKAVAGSSGRPNNLLYVTIIPENCGVIFFPLCYLQMAISLLSSHLKKRRNCFISCACFL